MFDCFDLTCDCHFFVWVHLRLQSTMFLCQQNTSSCFLRLKAKNKKNNFSMGVQYAFSDVCAADLPNGQGPEWVQLFFCTYIGNMRTGWVYHFSTFGKEETLRGELPSSPGTLGPQERKDPEKGQTLRERPWKEIHEMERPWARDPEKQDISRKEAPKTNKQKKLKECPPKKNKKNNWKKTRYKQWHTHTHTHTKHTNTQIILK